MNDRLAAAQAALNAGRKDEAIELLKSAIDDNPAQPAGAYRVLSVQLYQANRFDEGDVYSAIGVAQHPREFDLLNTRGVILRKLKRYPEAAAVLERAIKVNPKNTAAPSNLGNVLLDMGAAARAEQYFAKLARQDPRNAEVQRQLGRTLQKQGKREAALVRFRSAVALKKDFIDAWLDMVGDLNDKNLSQEAEALCERALEANPGNERLLEAKAIVVRRAGQARRAEAYLLELVPSLPDAAWLQYQLGTSISDYDRDRANVHMRRAVELAPDNLDYLMALIESLERTRAGDEGANIEESARLAHRALARKAEFTPVHLKVMQEVLVRVCAFEDMAELGDPGTIARALAESGRHTALLKQLPQIRTDADRLSILEAHRIWGRDVERKAAEQPIVRPPPRAAGGKIRLGFMSSDLRRHPVGYFTEPLFEHLDHERFEVFIYSYNQGEKDAMQDWITQKVTAYRWWPDISSRDAAQAIANDELDLLVELGGSTHMNKLDVMAYRPAARQASWLGYPHSSGLSTIDYLIVDPYLKPEREEFLIEAPMLMPSSWIALGRQAFPEAHVIEPGAPFERHGSITFGTANNSYKYTPPMFEAWARILIQTPGSRFLFVRPEGGTATFRDNVIRHFGAGGVGPERVDFVTVRGAHMQHYNKIDICLDTFPQTGGTTTCEALWMGAPTISLVGPTLYERLSYSILVNGGLEDLCVTSVDDYVAKAVALSADRARILDIRANQRARLKASPLGQTQQFAKDFYDMVARTLSEPAPKKRR